MNPTWTSDCGTVKLWKGDCLNVMQTWEEGVVDAVVTDPPYGINETHKNHLSSVVLRNGDSRQDLGFEGIDAPALADIQRQFVRASRGWAVFTCEWQHAHSLPDLVRLGIWRKPDGAPQFTGDRPGTGWEAVAICHRPGRKKWNGGGRHAFWTYTKRGTTGHPTEKPIGLVSEWIRDFSNFGNTIADPFMGSGTTGVAAVRLGREFWGVELDPGYFEIAKKRILAELNRFPLIEPKAKKPKQRSLELSDA